MMDGWMGWKEERRSKPVRGRKRLALPVEPERPLPPGAALLLAEKRKVLFFSAGVLSGHGRLADQEARLRNGGHTERQRRATAKPQPPLAPRGAR